MPKYMPWFEFVNTIEEAKERVKTIRKFQTRYQNKRYPPHFTPWESEDGTEHKFVVWSCR